MLWARTLQLGSTTATGFARDQGVKTRLPKTILGSQALACAGAPPSPIPPWQPCGAKAISTAVKGDSLRGVKGGKRAKRERRTAITTVLTEHPAASLWEETGCAEDLDTGVWKVALCVPVLVRGCAPRCRASLFSQGLGHVMVPSLAVLMPSVNCGQVF